MGASGYVHLDVDTIKRETDRAFLVVIGDEEVWLPKSLVSDADDYEEGDEDVCLSVPEWFASKEGLV